MPVEIVSGQVYIQVNALPSTVWTLAYRNLVHQKERTSFIPIRHEDEEFIPRCFYFANQVKHINLTAYHYIQKPKHPSYKTIKEQDSLIISKPMDKSAKQFASKLHQRNTDPTSIGKTDILQTL